MKISNINQTSFSGIKLPKAQFEYARNIKCLLEQNGIEVAGHKTFYVSSDNQSKRILYSFIRDAYDFKPKECGVVFLPWSKETWLVANPILEQKLKNILKDAKINAKIYLSI